MKGSVELDRLSSSQFQSYAALCAKVLARAHAQSPLSVAAAAYLGKSDEFDQAMASWADQYADHAERDFERLRGAADRGEIPVEYDV